ncbi:MAG: serine/threonine protein kinase [Planctomycetes bacterium]|nr:serine/threonine protein kinase [Planctomycetota bacterium]
MDLLAGGMTATIGRYRVVSELGRGAMGVVYAVEADGAPARLALKVLLGADPSVLERFRREADALRFLSRHPGIVSLRDLGVHDGRPYVVMDLVDGGSLERRLAAGDLPREQGARLLVGVARALHFAHEAGWVHRDVKPANVLLDRAGRPVVSDFGVARDLHGADLTRTGELVGTIAYMAPEQADGRREEIDRRTDVYALGAVLYEVLTGRRPFEGGGASVLVGVLQRPPVPPRERAPDVSPALEAVCLRALAKAPGERQPTAEDFARELEAALDGARPAASRSRGRALAPAFALTLALLAGAGGFAAGRGAPPAPAAAPSQDGDADAALGRAARLLVMGRLDDAAPLLADLPAGAEADRLRHARALAAGALDEAAAVVRRGVLGDALPRWRELALALAAAGRAEDAVKLALRAAEDEALGPAQARGGLLAATLDAAPPDEPAVAGACGALALRLADDLLAPDPPTLEAVALAQRLALAGVLLAPPERAPAAVDRLAELGRGQDEALALAATPWRGLLPRALWDDAEALLGAPLAADARVDSNHRDTIPMSFRTWRHLSHQGSQAEDEVTVGAWVLRRPELSTGWLHLGRIVGRRDPRRGLPALRRARALETSAEVDYWLATFARLAGRDDEARAAAAAALEKGHGDWHRLLLVELELAVRQDDASPGRRAWALLLANPTAEPLGLPSTWLGVARSLAAGGASPGEVEQVARQAWRLAAERAATMGLPRW